eukprot:scaffold3515_cov94-Isochrysis_galbana.AAC.1
MPGGGPPPPGGGAGRPGYIWGAELSDCCGIICPIPGPPTPRTGPARPAGAVCGAMAIPRPAAFATPGPPSAPATGLRRSSCGGGPSTDMETTASPRMRTRPSVRFSSRSSFLPERQRWLRNTAESAGLSHGIRREVECTDSEKAPPGAGVVCRHAPAFCRSAECLAHGWTTPAKQQTSGVSKSMVFVAAVGPIRTMAALPPQEAVATLPRASPARVHNNKMFCCCQNKTPSSPPLKRSVDRSRRHVQLQHNGLLETAQGGRVASEGSYVV